MVCGICVFEETLVKKIAYLDEIYSQDYEAGFVVHTRRIVEGSVDLFRGIAHGVHMNFDMLIYEDFSRIFSMIYIQKQCIAEFDLYLRG